VDRLVPRGDDRRAPWIASGGELGRAITLERPRADAVADIQAVRSDQVQQDVAERVALLVGSPPQVLVGDHVQTLSDLRRIVIDHS